jgi:hypothetical protein
VIENGWVDTGNGWVEEIGAASQGPPERPLTREAAMAWSEEFPAAGNRFNGIE